MKKFLGNHNDIISIDNLLEAWKVFIIGKKQKEDVQEFERNLMSNILDLHQDLKNKTYAHSSYHAFNISDPKPRSIHKASVRDRLLHHAIYKILYPYFDKLFIYDSYSCRLGKGTHKALNRFNQLGHSVSKNNTKQCFILKCDIRKFFASIDHTILLNILNKHINDTDILRLIAVVVESFNSGKEGRGLPLGNLTSQLLVNIYMNEFDQYIKHKLKITHYIRYADDFVFFDTNKDNLLEHTPKISDYLEENLKLQLHPNKVFIKTLSSGMDFLGWIHFSTHRVLRTATKRRMFRNLSEKNRDSYTGMLGWGNGWKLEQKILGML